MWLETGRWEYSLALTWSTCSVSEYWGYTLLNSLNDSWRDGRDSWLVKWVFGKMDDVVVAAKLWRHAEELFLDFDCVLCGDASELKNGTLQQHWGHDWKDSFWQRFCIFLCFFSPFSALLHKSCLYVSVYNISFSSSYWISWSLLANRHTRKKEHLESYIISLSFC